MAITYPLTPPASPKVSNVRWTDVNTAGISASPYSLQRQTYDWGGCGWAVAVSIDPLTREEASPWIAFLSSLRGLNGTFLFGDELFSSPLGAAGGTPKVNGAGQTGFTLATDGWPNSTLVLKAGDMFQVGTSLYRNLTDATTNGSGAVTLDIWPRAKAHADNSDIVTTDPVGLFRLADNSQVTQDANRNQLYNISFQAVEAL